MGKRVSERWREWGVGQRAAVALRAGALVKSRLERGLLEHGAALVGDPIAEAEEELADAMAYLAWARAQRRALELRIRELEHRQVPPPAGVAAAAQALLEAVAGLRAVADLRASEAALLDSTAALAAEHLRQAASEAAQGRADGEFSVAASGMPQRDQNAPYAPVSANGGSGDAA